MLVLTRRIGESLIIGDDVELTVLDIRGNQVRIGINAPKAVKVLREELVEDELYDQMADEVAPTDGV